MRGDVVAASGPWRTSGDWWREDAWQQDEWDLEIRFGSAAEAMQYRSAAIGTRIHGREPSGNPRRGLYRIYYDCAVQELVRARDLRLMYIELHARSAFSFLEGASMPEELAGVCAEHGMPAMALLDRDGVYGAPRFHLAAKKIANASAHRRRSDVRRGLALSAAGRIARGLPESLPPDHADEIARAKRRRPRFGRGSCRTRQRADLPHRRRGRSAGARAGARRNRGRRRECVRQLCEIFGRAKCIRRIAAALLPRRRGAQPGGDRNRAEIAFAAAGDQRRLPRAAAAAGSAGRLHLHSPSPHSGHRRATSEPAMPSGI